MYFFKEVNLDDKDLEKNLIEWESNLFQECMIIEDRKKYDTLESKLQDSLDRYLINKKLNPKIFLN